MNDASFTTTLTVGQAPEAVFAAVNNVRGWWSEEVRGSTDKVGGAFDYHFRDIHRCRIQVTELVPGRRVAWHLLENHFSFTGDKSEWVGTDIVFDIRPTGTGTELHFTHKGLVPAYECFDICSNEWSSYFGRSLRDLIVTGKGHPNARESVAESDRH